MGTGLYLPHPNYTVAIVAVASFPEIENEILDSVNRGLPTDDFSNT